MMTASLVPFLTWRFVSLFVCLIALVRGRRPERLSAVVILFASVLTGLVLRSRPWKPIEPDLIFIDSCVAVFFVALALKSSRWWPLWAAAFHLLAVITLLIDALDTVVRPYAYYVGEQIWDYMGLMALLLGSLVEGRRDLGGDRPFQASSSASAR
jgi:hypothetical protein